MYCYCNISFLFSVWYLSLPCIRYASFHYSCQRSCSFIMVFLLSLPWTRFTATSHILIVSIIEYMIEPKLLLPCILVLGLISCCKFSSIDHTSRILQLLIISSAADFNRRPIKILSSMIHRTIYPTQPLQHITLTHR